MKFEDVWTIKGATYLREYDPSTKSSRKLETSFKSEFYEPQENGEYLGFLDGVKLSKRYGSAYENPNAYGVKAAKYVAIREKYFGENFNQKPRTWFLDIETSVSSFVYQNSTTKVRLKGTKRTKEINVLSIQENKIPNNYEVYDEEEKVWKSPMDSCYLKRNSTGFPQADLALEPIVLMQFYDTQEEKGYILGLEDWYYQDDYVYNFDLEFIKYDSEVEMLQGFLKLFKKLDPLIIYAWNGGGFDYPYIFNRLKKIKIPTRLSNYGTAKLKSKILSNGQVVNTIDAPGHYWVDMLDVYKKFIFDSVPNYAIDTIAEKEINMNKVNHDNYIKFDDFRLGKYVITGNETQEQKETRIYKCAMMLEQGAPKEKAKVLREYIRKKSYSDFVDYGVNDFVILKGIHDKRNFTELMVEMAQKMSCTIPDTLGTLKAWDSYITSYIYQDNLIAPARASNSDASVVGGYVRDPIKGKHNWILSSDVNSMYPLLGMAAFNMSPETFIPFDERPEEVQALNRFLGTQDELKILNLSDEEWGEIKRVSKKYNVSLGIGGAVYRKDIRGTIPKLVTEIYANRKIAKKLMFKYEQQAIDIKEELHKRKGRK